MFGGGNMGHMEMHMTDGRAFLNAAPFGDMAVQLLQDALKVKRIDRHPERPVGELPFVARTVAVDLYAVAVGVGQVERLADGVVAGPAKCGARKSIRWCNVRANARPRGHRMAK